jgi:hypothetical protein
MDCEACRNLLLDSLDAPDAGSPGPDTVAHLERCGDCREWWKDVRAAARCLRDTRPLLLEAPPVTAVWDRIREADRVGQGVMHKDGTREAVGAGFRTHPLRIAAFGWAMDILSVLIAAAIIVVAGIGLRALLPGWDIPLPALSPPSGSLFAEAWTAALILVLFGMFAGACSAPLLLRGRVHGFGRHEKW